MVMADWSGEEIELIAADYFDMFSLVLPSASPNRPKHDARSLKMAKTKQELAK